MAVNISEISVSVNSDCTVISKYNLYAGKDISTFPSTSNKGENRKKRGKSTSYERWFSRSNWVLPL